MSSRKGNSVEVEWLGDRKIDKGRRKLVVKRHQLDKNLSAYQIKYLDFITDESEGDILVFKIAKVPLDLKR